MQPKENGTIYMILHSISLSPPPPKMMMGDNLQSQILEGGRSEKNEYLGGLKESLPQMFTRGVTMFLVKKIL